MYSSYRQHFTAFWAFALLAITIFWGASAYAITPANTIIKSRATVTYQDSLGNNFAAESNEATVVVAEVFSAILDPKDGQIKEGTIGQIVNFPHQLINNGNTADSFTVGVAASVGKFVEDSLKVYLDTNGNGQADAGEPEITQHTVSNEVYAGGMAVTVDAGKTTNLVVAAQVPQGAPASLSLVLTAYTANSSFTTGKTAISTDTITVVDNKPVLTITKEVISHTPPKWNYEKTPATPQLIPGSITYNVKVINNGADLEKGAIYDFFPDFMDVVKLPSNAAEDNAGITVNLKSDARLGTPEVAENLFTEAGITNTDKLDTFGLKIPFASKLASGSNTSFELTITYSAKATENGPFNFFEGDKLENTVYVGHANKPAASGTKWEHVDKSNTTSEVLPNLFDVLTPATATTPADPVYGGGIVEYAVDVTNTGNSADSFNLSIQKDPNTFPAGTTFSYWLGGVSLADNNTGSIPHREKVTVTVKAQLPEILTPTPADDKTPQTATFVATSVGDNLQNDSTVLTLPTIGTSSVDIAYTKEALTSETPDADPYPATPPASGDKTDGFQPAEPGTTAIFDLFVHNQTGVSRSFSLKAFRGVNDGGSMGNYEGEEQPELQVTFKKGGKVVTQTSTLGTETGKDIEQLTVEVTVPAGQEAKNYSFAVIADGGTGLNDAIAYTVKVTQVGGPALTPDGSNQIAAGGATFYTHRLINNSNTTRSFMVKGKNSATSWLHVMTPPTPSEPQSAIVHEITNSYVAAELKPNQYLDFTVKVIAPANAAPGSRDVLTLSVYEVTKNGEDDGFTVGDTVLTTATDTTIVVEGQVRLYKKVYVIDEATPPANPAAAINVAKDLASDIFAITANKQAIPDKDYVVWQVIAINQGDTLATNVIIRDTEPTFTKLVAGSAMAKQAGEENFATVDAIDGTNVTFAELKALNPGASVEVRFMVKVQ